MNSPDQGGQVIMAFLSEDELESLGFRYLGKDVRLSDAAKIYQPELIELHDRCRVDDFCVISGRVTIGRNVHVAVFCNLAGGEKGIIMEDFSGLAYGVHVFTQSDDYSGRTLTNPTVPDQYKSETKLAITIGRHSIVGTQSIIVPGANLAEGTSVGALSLVMTPTNPWGIYVGVPAKRLKDRRKDLLALEEEYLKELGQNVRQG